MSSRIVRAYVRASQQAPEFLSRLRKSAQREEGDISQYLFMGIMILIVLAIAAVLWQFGGQIMEVIRRAIDALTQTAP